VPGVASPTEFFTNPTNGALVGGAVQVSVAALDRVGIAKVEFYRDGALLGTSTTAPYNFSWDTAKEATGGHQLTAKSYNTAGASDSQTIIVTVRRSPTITLSAPQTVLPGDAVGLSAQAAKIAHATERCQRDGERPVGFRLFR
jgi:hypothetical protein